jgi:hypothetical protein
MPANVLRGLTITVAMAAILAACPPDRSDNDNDGGGRSSLWVVLTQVQGGSESESHNFMSTSGSVSCSRLQAFYEASSTAQQAFWVTRQDIQARFEYGSRDYASGMCNAYRDLYLTIGAVDPLYLDGRTLTSLVLYHPDSVQGEPHEGEYGGSQLVDDDDSGWSDDDDSAGWREERGLFDPYFSGSFVKLEGDYYDALAESTDCENLRNDDGYYYYRNNDAGIGEIFLSWSIGGGSITLASTSSTTWNLTVDGVELTGNDLPDDGLPAFGGTYQRCDVRYETPDYYGYGYIGR